jgi:phage tail-like protein
MVMDLAPWESPVPVAFQFAVTFGDLSLRESAFREVSGLSTELDVETVPDGGGGVYMLPKGWKHSRLSLKRGVAANGTTLVEWCRRTLEQGLNLPIQTRSVWVMLLGADGDPLRGWMLTEAYPVKWSIDPFNSTNNNVAVENIELVYANLIKVL